MVKYNHNGIYRNATRIESFRLVSPLLLIVTATFLLPPHPKTLGFSTLRVSPSLSKLRGHPLISRFRYLIFDLTLLSSPRSLSS
ncbi:hypothetical protein IGI04_008329 [Brassica rapa subsp. trilocularis]|uniref:Uncharacterized protein n=1 Tax=Brassica rapa subsp. trilocularis TaxID=1813537 RepID=A0ABQ7NMB3_BRACM|nr:hypothetical protein IGI04_008329 [Brassica rapa subsp. trilocularis]